MNKAIRIFCTFLILFCVGFIPAKASNIHYQNAINQKGINFARRAPTCPYCHNALYMSDQNPILDRTVSSKCSHGYPFGDDLTRYRTRYETWTCENCGYESHLTSNYTTSECYGHT